LTRNSMKPNLMSKISVKKKGRGQYCSARELLCVLQLRGDDDASVTGGVDRLPI
jgi:hypothetical protein